MTIGAFFFLVTAAGCVVLSFASSKSLWDKQGGNALLVVLSTIWAATAGYIAGQSIGKHTTSEEVHEAMMIVLPEPLRQEVIDMIHLRRETQASGRI